MRYAAGRDLLSAEQLRESREAWAELGLVADAYAPRAPTLDPVGELPVITPETWRGVQCHCAHCDVCSWFKVIWAAAAADDHRDGKGHSRAAEGALSAPRWRSVSQALQTFGTSEGRLEATGSLGRVLEELEGLGVQVQTSRSRTRLGSRSDDFVEVEKAIDRALPPGKREGLSRERAIALVLVRVVGVWRRQPKPNAYGRPWSRREVPSLAETADHFEMNPKAVTRLVRRAMHGLRVELGARGLAPMPAMGSRAHHEAHRRRDELKGAR